MVTLKYTGQDNELTKLVNKANLTFANFNEAIEKKFPAVAQAFFYVQAMISINKLYLRITEPGERKKWVEDNLSNLLSMFIDLQNIRKSIDESKITEPVIPPPNPPINQLDIKNKYLAQKIFNDDMIRQISMHIPMPPKFDSGRSGVDSPMPDLIPPQGPLPRTPPAPKQDSCLKCIKDCCEKLFSIKL